MDDFTIEIARTPFAIRPAFGSTREYFKNYCTEKAPVFPVEITQEEREQEQTLLDLEADAEGLRRRSFTPPFLERTAIQRKIAGFLLKQDILLFHGSTIAVDGRCYLFTAKCGVGKSTHTRLWREHFGAQAVMVNDDRAFLQLTEEGVLAYGSPWSGKHGLDTNLCTPLAGICILERGTENHIAPASGEECLPRLLEQVFVPTGECSQTLECLTSRLAQTVPLWRMSCTKSPEAAMMAYEAMSLV